MTVISQTALIVIFSFILIKSVTLLVTSASRLARFLNISEYLISFLVIAFATSLPELVVGIVSALDNQSILSLGNVLGSNIVDLTLILAIPIFVGGQISTKTLINSKDLFSGTLLGLLPVVLLFDNHLSRFEGALLVLTYIIYIVSVLRSSKDVHRFNIFAPNVNAIKEFVILFLSALALWLSAATVVHLAENISATIGIPIIIIGLLVTALGTSLPELAFGLKAVTTHHDGEVLGNAMGSVIANSTLILGVTSLISPINYSIQQNIFTVFFLVFLIGVFFVFSKTKGILSRVEATILTILYLAFVLITL